MLSEYKFKAFFGKFTLPLIFSVIAASASAESGTVKDNEYAAKVWKVLQEENLNGKDRVRSFPFVGNRPHGSIQEIIATEVTVDGHKGRIVVKHNYGNKEGLTTHSVYETEESQDYVALPLCFSAATNDGVNNSYPVIP